MSASVWRLLCLWRMATWEKLLYQTEQPGGFGSNKWIEALGGQMGKRSWIEITKANPFLLCLALSLLPF